MIFGSTDASCANRIPRASQREHGERRRREAGSERQMLHHIAPFIGLGDDGDHFEIRNVLSHRRTKQMANHKSLQSSSLTRPVCGHGFESNVLRKQDSPQCR